MNGLRIPAHSASCQGAFDAVNLALTRCAQRSNQTRKLYAIDNDVVRTPDR
jgi:hypothetical protein